MPRGGTKCGKWGIEVCLVHHFGDLQCPRAPRSLWIRTSPPQGRTRSAWAVASRSIVVAMEFLDRVADRPFTSAMAVAGGATRDQVRDWVRTGTVRRILSDVYVDASAADGVELRARAASLVLPEHAVVCDRSAAWLHGVDVLEFAEHDLVPDLDVVSVNCNNPSRRRGIFGGKRDLLESEITVVQGVRVTTPLRTVCDLACLRGRWQAMAVLDAFRRAFGITEAELRAMLPRFAGRRGCRQLRELIPLSTDQADSRPESWTRIIIHDEGLPVPAAQVWVVLPSGRRARVENAYAYLRIGVEYDGEEDHTTDEDRDHDDGRRGELDDEGWIILVLRKHDFGPRQREAWLRELRAAIDSRSPERASKRIYARGPDEPSYRWKRRRH